MLCGFISTAPLAAEMRELIETCIDAPLFDIYGLTEVAGVARDGVIRARG